MLKTHSKTKEFLLFLCAVCMVLLLCSCAKEPSDTSCENLVYIVENEFYKVVDNGVYVSSGKNVRFAVEPASGYSITGTDYPGPYRIWQSGKQTFVELLSVNYPTRVELKYTSRYRTITYKANGGIAAEGNSSELSVTYDVSLHLRPNTSNGVGLFNREGYTLESWNTEPDGSGLRIGLGSRVSVELSGLTLYAQWAKWTDVSEFVYARTEDGIVITDYIGSASTLVIPQKIDGLPVISIAAGAFYELPSTKTVILSPTLQTVEEGAFSVCNFSTLVLYDNLETFSDAAFDCAELNTLYINAVEAPYGYEYRRESMYADKIDLLIEAVGQKKMVFYAGCSVWYNLDSQSIKDAFGSEYKIINLGLNGTLNSWIQMVILTEYIEDGDLLIHTPELASTRQMMDSIDMVNQDNMLWCGLENNYDLFALVDISEINGVFDSFCYYLGKKNKATTYDDQRYTTDGYPYIDDIGCIPFTRTETSETLLDTVNLDTDKLKNRSYDNLQECYRRLTEKGVSIFVSYAVLNVDALSEEQSGNIAEANSIFNEVISEMDGPVIISNLGDFLYRHDDFYDTNYHLLSKQAVHNTAVWIRDIKQQLNKD